MSSGKAEQLQEGTTSVLGYSRALAVFSEQQGTSRVLGYNKGTRVQQTALLYSTRPNALTVPYEVPCCTRRP